MPMDAMLEDRTHMPEQQDDLDFPDVKLQDEKKQALDSHYEKMMESNSGVMGDNFRRLSASTKAVGKNSNEFQTIMRTLQTISQAMDTIVDKEVGNFAVAGLMNSYSALVAQCDNYLGKSTFRFTRTGKERVSLVQQIKQDTLTEAQVVMDRLSKIDDFGEGLTIRQLLVGMKPLQAVSVDIGDMDLPEMDTSNADVPGELTKLRDALRSATDVDAKTSKLLDILVETLLRNKARNETDILPDIFNRIKEVCTDQKSPIVLAIAEQCENMDKQLGLKPTVSPMIYQGQSFAEELPEGTDFSDEALNLAYPEYKHLSPALAVEMARSSPFNQGAKRDQIYGDKLNTRGRSKGYILTSYSNDINAYLRGLADRSNKDKGKLHKDNVTLATIGLLDQAADGGVLPQKTRLHRMVNAPYLQHCLGINLVDESIGPDAVAKINKMAGTIITDSGFMCTGYAVDLQFSNAPIMLTLLCDEGTPAFITGNHAESEIILGRNTSYMILGAKSHADKKLVAPGSHMDVRNQEVLGKEMALAYGGIEIIAKVINNKKGAKARGK